MNHQPSLKKTIFKIAIPLGGAALTAGIGMPWLGAMVGTLLAENTSEIFLAGDDEKKKLLKEYASEPVKKFGEGIASLLGDKAYDFYKAHGEAKESALNYDLPRTLVKVWKQNLTQMLPANRVRQIRILVDTGYEEQKSELINLWIDKLEQTEADDTYLWELFGNKPDYFLQFEDDKNEFIESLINETKVADLFWDTCIEKVFTKWAKDADKLPDGWEDHNDYKIFKKELRNSLFKDFSSKLKTEFKKNEKAWKSFQFTSSMQTISMLGSTVREIPEIKQTLSELKKETVDRFDNLEPEIRTLIESHNDLFILIAGFKADLRTLEKELKTLNSYNNLVLFEDWKIAKERRQEDYNKKFIETDSLKILSEEIVKNILFYKQQFIIKGNISSGKSTLIKHICENLLSNHENNVKIIILPVTPEYKLSDRNRTYDEFFKILEESSNLDCTNVLFVIEDAHEDTFWAKKNIREVVFNNRASNFSNVPLIVTTRPDGYDYVKTILENSWGISDAKTIDTVPDSIAEKIIEDETVSDLEKKALNNAYLRCGKLLFIFKEIINEWINRDKERTKNFMRYAYDAVFAELKRVLPKDEEKDDFAILTLLIIWMFGGLELAVEESFVERELDIRTGDLWEKLEDSNEIHRDEADKKSFRNSRHPAWGLLVIKAFDESSQFRHFRPKFKDKFFTAFENEFTEEIRNKIENSKPSVWLMLGFLLTNQEVAGDNERTIKRLNFYCRGQSLHDEFLEAVQVYLDIVGKENKSDEFIAGITLFLAGTTRRSNSTDQNAYNPEQRQEVINRGFEILQESIELRKKLYGDDLESDKNKGEVLYEEAYYLYLMGKFEESAKKFEESKSRDLETPNEKLEIPDRKYFGAMSGIREAISRIYVNQQTEFEQAEKILSEVREILTSYDSSAVEARVYKTAQIFMYNLFHAEFELHLARGETVKALDSLEEFIEQAHKVNLNPNDLIHKARVKLFERDGKEAEKLIREAMKDDELMKKGEDRISTHRVLGDALLLQKEKEKAIEEYNKILPSEDSATRYFDFDLKLAENRKDRVKNFNENSEFEEAFADLLV